METMNIPLYLKTAFYRVFFWSHAGDEQMVLLQQKLLEEREERDHLEVPSGLRWAYHLFDIGFIWFHGFSCFHVFFPSCSG